MSNIDNNIKKEVLEVIKSSEIKENFKKIIEIWQKNSFKTYDMNFFTLDSLETYLDFFKILDDIKKKIFIKIKNNKNFVINNPIKEAEIYYFISNVVEEKNKIMFTEWYKQITEPIIIENQDCQNKDFENQQTNNKNKKENK